MKETSVPELCWICDKTMWMNVILILYTIRPITIKEKQHESEFFVTVLHTKRTLLIIVSLRE